MNVYVHISTRLYVYVYVRVSVSVRLKRDKVSLILRRRESVPLDFVPTVDKLMESGLSSVFRRYVG